MHFNSKLKGCGTLYKSVIEEHALGPSALKISVIINYQLSRMDFSLVNK